MCTLPARVAGPECQHFDPCASSPCYNDGTCRNTSDPRRLCSCKDGFSGDLCQEFDSCKTNPCRWVRVCAWWVCVRRCVGVRAGACACVVCVRRCVCAPASVCAEVGVCVCVGGWVGAWVFASVRVRAEVCVCL